MPNTHQGQHRTISQQHLQRWNEFLETEGYSMTYKIAVASSEGMQVNETFGSATRFLVYTVMEDAISAPEERIYVSEFADKNCTPANSCCNGNGGGNGTQNCGGSAGVMAKVALVDDCRCIVYRKIGFQVQK
ncbi:MAG: hypothetical protein LUF89_01780 [Ruminococcus sp.]|nr:hypothetical protein [Ruminococcus sp.]